MYNRTTDACSLAYTQTSDLIICVSHVRIRVEKAQASEDGDSRP